jgi:polar amino acid transport system substrate-binding protein
MIRATVLMLFVSMLGSMVTLPAAAEDIRMTGSNWPPYVDDALHGDGFVVALVSDALKRAGYQAKMNVEPCPLSLEATQAGRYDVFCSLWYTDERAETLAFSEPFIENNITFIKRSDSRFQIEDRTDLMGLRIGVVDDYAYREQAYDTNGIEVTIAGSVRKNIERLLAGDVDLVLADSRVAFYEVNELGVAKNITVLRPALNTRGLRIAVSKSRADYQEIIDAFNVAIAAMKADGSYSSLLANHRISY